MSRYRFISVRRPCCHLHPLQRALAAKPSPSVGRTFHIRRECTLDTAAISATSSNTVLFVCRVCFSVVKFICSQPWLAKEHMNFAPACTSKKLSSAEQEHQKYQECSVSPFMINVGALLGEKMLHIFAKEASSAVLAPCDGRFTAGFSMTLPCEHCKRSIRRILRDSVSYTHLTLPTNREV